MDVHSRVLPFLRVWSLIIFPTNAMQSVRETKHPLACVMVCLLVDLPPHCL